MNVWQGAHSAQRQGRDSRARRQEHPRRKDHLVSTLNVYEILKYNTLILTKDSVAKIEEVYA